MRTIPLNRRGRRRGLSGFGDTDWGAAAAATANLVAGILNIATSGSTQQPPPQCAPGYYYNTTTRRCEPIPGQPQAGVGMDNQMMLIAGGGLLLVGVLLIALKK